MRRKLTWGLVLGLALVLLLALLAAPALAAKTITVKPSGGDDTAHIQKAFKAAVRAGPGSTVRLTAGHFYTNNVLVQNFKGYFKGAGEGVTVIDTLRGKYPNGPGVTLTPDPCHPATYLEPFAFLIGFRGGNVSVSAMSFNITAPDPAEPFFEDPDFTDRTSLGEVILVTGNASSVFDRVSFTAGAGDLSGLNVGGDIGILGKALKGWDEAGENWIWLSLGPTRGVHSVTRCSFAGLSGVEVMGLTAGRLIVGGCAARQNVFDEYWEGCFLGDISNSYIEISHNQMTATLGGVDVAVMQGYVAGWGGGAPLPPLPAPRYVITENDMRASGDYAAGVSVWDLSYPTYGAAGRLDAVIADNTLVLGPEGESLIGIGEYCTKNIKVLHNCLSGSAMAGIYVGDNAIDDPPTLFYPVSGWRIIGNDLRKLTASVAPIVLGEGSTHCVVVCPTRTDVLDKGVHNILVNANRLPWSP